ncbi:polyprenyl synthetase family protein [Eubacterium sp. MSJ-13]|uniref:polyprenyl synthetase family protein n=1 Tax=Eubacterium sp. MSJ-13 TaxID=2841513 RepID=UPI001C116DC6|nr:farnesyl diphosphate synthase [Eubacterium sp. MSJ-13]MBU5479237.1 polyprenyl synthetase family protein [Eubacterium sp. MSJ-13]
METAEFKEEQERNISYIEDVLKRFLPKAPSYQKTIYDAMEYSVMAGGKRLRPMMMYQTYKMFGGDDEKLIEPFMAAIEIIHTYSLVHDDLPAMDNDEYRRGRKTTHVVYGEDMGILAGDALLNFAYETAIRGAAAASDSKNAIRALGILSEKAGITGMVGGQVVDVELTGKKLDEKQLDFIFRLKTGALLEASLMSGAALAGADERYIALMEQAGLNIGMAFQIQDDILDITSTTSELGKPVHSDEKNEKTTYVSLYGMEKAHEDVKIYSEKALSIMKDIPFENRFLYTLIEKLINRRK